MEALFIIISFIQISSVAVFLFGLIMRIVSKSEVNKKLATQLLIYSTIAFIIGFGTCFGVLIIGI